MNFKSTFVFAGLALTTTLGYAKHPHQVPSITINAVGTTTHDCQQFDQLLNSFDQTNNKHAVLQCIIEAAKVNEEKFKEYMRKFCSNIKSEHTNTTDSSVSYNEIFPSKIHKDYLTSPQIQIPYNGEKNKAVKYLATFAYVLWIANTSKKSENVDQQKANKTADQTIQDCRIQNGMDDASGWIAPQFRSLSQEDKKAFNTDYIWVYDQRHGTKWHDKTHNRNFFMTSEEWEQMQPLPVSPSKRRHSTR